MYNNELKYYAYGGHELLFLKHELDKCFSSKNNDPDKISDKEKVDIGISFIKTYFTVMKSDEGKYLLLNTQNHGYNTNVEPDLLSFAIDNIKSDIYTILNAYRETIGMREFTIDKNLNCEGIRKIDNDLSCSFVLDKKFYNKTINSNCFFKPYPITNNGFMFPNKVTLLLCLDFIFTNINKGLTLIQAYKGKKTREYQKLSKLFLLNLESAVMSLALTYAYTQSEFFNKFYYNTDANKLVMTIRSLSNNRYEVHMNEKTKMIPMNEEAFKG